MGWKRRQSGFAMLMVMMLVVMSAILGLSYLTSTTVNMVGSQNILSATRAQYLAESGIQHALYLLNTNPSQLDGTSKASPKGPYFADTTSDSYVFYSESTGTPGLYNLKAEATVAGITRTTSTTVYRKVKPSPMFSQAMIIGGALGQLPSNLTIEGSVHVNGLLSNYAMITGDVSSVYGRWGVDDPLHRIQGSITSASYQPAPPIQPAYYTNYSVPGMSGSAVVKVGSSFSKNDDLANGGAITAANPGGVVILRKTGGGAVKLANNLNFQGTLICEGGVVLEGNNVTITPVKGFPAIVTTGTLWVGKTSSTTINGVVVAGGVAPWSQSANNSAMTIIGGLVCPNGFNSMNGTHLIRYEQANCELYNFSPGASSTQGVAKLTLLSAN